MEQGGGMMEEDEVGVRRDAGGRLRVAGDTNTESCRELLSSDLSVWESPVVL